MNCPKCNSYVSGDNCKVCGEVLKEKKKPITKIKKVSDKRKVEEKEYKKLRKEFLESRMRCEARLLGCTVTSTDVHHKSGRGGGNYLDTKTWLSLCRSCHSKIHDVLSSKEAKEKGLKE
jgi:hypothetical protein